MRHVAGPNESLDFEFRWPLELTPQRTALSLYHWARIDGRTGLWLLGIRPFAFRPPFRLAEAGLRIFQGDYVADGAGGTDGLEGYLVIEVDSTLTARAALAFVAPNYQWYVLDEYRFPVGALHGLR